MDTERVAVPGLRSALAAACPSLAVGTASDAVGGVVPSFVASPASTAEAASLLRAAASCGLAVVPRGASTGLSWGAPPSACDLVVDLLRVDSRPHPRAIVALPNNLHRRATRCRVPFVASPCAASFGPRSVSTSASRTASRRRPDASSLETGGLEHLLLERFERGLDLVVEDRNFSDL